MKNLLYITDDFLHIRQAVKNGYIKCPISLKRVVDLSFSTSKLRRGRVQDNGEICPAITTVCGDICVIEEIYKRNKNN